MMAPVVSNAALSERVRALEIAMLHTPSKSEVAQLKAELHAASEIIQTFIDLKNYHNEKTEDRVSAIEIATTELRVRMALIGMLASAAMTSVLGIVTALITGLLGGK